MDGKKGKKMRVIVIGGGMAGLTVATQLKRTGQVDVLVIEAQDSLGGRTRTVDFPERPEGSSANAVPIDMGAAWIHGLTGNPLVALADEAKATLFDFGHEDLIPPIFDSEGHFITEEEKRTPQRHYDDLVAFMNDAKPLLRREQRDISLKDAVSRMCREDPEFDACWNSLGTEGQLLRWIVGSIESFYACPKEVLSVAFYDDWKMYPGGDALVKSGYSTIIRHLSSLLDPHESRVLSPVRSIVWEATQSQKTSRRPQIVVTTERGEEFEADVVVVTVSLGVLQSKTIDFRPQLPRFKQHAIDSMGFGLMNKVVLRFPRVFWHSCINNLFFGLADPVDRFRWWVNFYPICQQPIIVCLVVNEFAHEVEDLAIRSVCFPLS